MKNEAKCEIIEKKKKEDLHNMVWLGIGSLIATVILGAFAILQSISNQKKSQRTLDDIKDLGMINLGVLSQDNRNAFSNSFKSSLVRRIDRLVKKKDITTE